jgi:hypothetical protein
MVLWALENSQGGEIFVPKIPSYRITDVAMAIGPTCQYPVIGIRPGEKIHEEMITGSDSWSWGEQERFWPRAIALAEASGLAVSFETHRSRSLANPWAMADWLAAFPGLRLTADLSHWCVVAERLMTPELAPIQAMAAHVDHIHARIGHAQGPQVNHPFAPEHHQALAAHLACWKLFAASLANHQADHLGDHQPRPLTLTPEFGPDGYLPTLPFTNQPVADLLEINTAMALWLRQELGAWSPGLAPCTGP